MNPIFPQHTKQFLLLTMLVGLPAAGWSNQDGTDTALFLALGQGARAEGMGGAYTAVADDSYATYWNPAGLARITNQRLAFNHMSYVEDISSQFAAYALPVAKARGTLGLNISYMNFGTIDRRDSNGLADGGDSEVKAMAGGVSWGQVISKSASFGFGVKSFSENLAGSKVSGFAGDAGLFVAAVPDRLHVGIAVSNIGPKVSVGTTDEDIPLTVRGGIAFYPVRQWVIDADMSKEKAADARAHIGTEYLYQGMFAIRAGYQDTKDAGGGLSFGAGFIWHPSSEGRDFFGNRRQFLGKRPNSNEEEVPTMNDAGFQVRFDYAYVDYGDLETTHRIGIELAF